MNKLKPCPFCGSDAMLVNLKGTPRGYQVTCSKVASCPVFPFTHCSFRQRDVIAAWNTRCGDQDKRKRK